MMPGRMLLSLELNSRSRSCGGEMRGFAGGVFAHLGAELREAKEVAEDSREAGHDSERVGGLDARAWTPMSGTLRNGCDHLRGARRCCGTARRTGSRSFWLSVRRGSRGSLALAFWREICVQNKRVEGLRAQCHSAGGRCKQLKQSIWHASASAARAAAAGRPRGTVAAQVVTDRVHARAGARDKFRELKRGRGSAVRARARGGRRHSMR